MLRKNPLYPPEFRRQMVDLVRAGRTPADLVREFEPSEQCICNWAARADRDEGRRQDGLKGEERTELKRLRKEARVLAKATAWFARETDSVSTGPSSSSR